MPMTKAQVVNLTGHVNAVAQHFDFLPIAEHCARAAAFPSQKARAPKRPTDLPEHPRYRTLVKGIHDLYTHELNGRRGNHLFYTFDDAGRDGVTITFHAIDTTHTFADPLLIQVARSLLSQLGYEHRIRINMIGDSEAKRRFIKELADYFKRSGSQIPESIRSISTKDVLTAYRALLATNDDAAYTSPVSINHLNEKSRRSLRETLDYLDLSETPYEIDPRLTGDYDYHSGFLFTVDVAPTRETITSPCSVIGGSYDDYAHKHHDDRHSCASVTFRFTNHTEKPLPQKSTNGTTVALAAIGATPKLYSYGILDTLLAAGISAHHNPISLSLSDQLRHAQKNNVDIILIAGTHEANRKEVIIRDVRKEKQTTIPLEKLIKALNSCTS